MEDLFEMAGQEITLILLVEDAEAGAQARPLRLLAQQRSAQGVDGGDTHPGGVARIARCGGHRGETLPEFAGGGPVVGAERQLIVFAPAVMRSTTRSFTEMVTVENGPSSG